MKELALEIKRGRAKNKVNEFRARLWGFLIKKGNSIVVRLEIEINQALHTRKEERGYGLLNFDLLLVVFSL